MSPSSDILVLVPMLSSTPDGTITAGLGVRRLLAANSPRMAMWDRWFLWVNDCITWRWPRWAVRWLVLHLAVLMDRDRPKIFTSHHSPFFSSGHLVVIHDVIPFRQPKRYPAQTLYTRHFLGTVMGAADCVVTISNTVRDALLELFPEVRGKLCVIPSYSAKLETIKVPEQQINIIRDSRRFLMVGMTRRHKNLDWGAAGVELAANSVAGLVLDAVGVWEDFWPEVYEAAATLGRRSRLNLHGYVDDTTLDALYRRAGALFYLSSDEGMGLPPLEALARGCPVVCSDIPIFREVCGHAAFYVPLGDTVALARIIVRLARGELDLEIEKKLGMGRERVAAYGAAPLNAKWNALIADYTRCRAQFVI